VSYLDACGNRGRGGDVTVTDVGIDFECASAGVADLFCGIDLRPDAWMFHWQTGSGTVALWRNGEVVAEQALGAATAPVQRVEFGFLDGRFFFALDGSAARSWCLLRRPAWTSPDPRPMAQP